jgi:uncharacterized membrane protein
MRKKEYNSIYHLDNMYDAMMLLKPLQISIKKILINFHERFRYYHDATHAER